MVTAEEIGRIPIFEALGENERERLCRVAADIVLMAGEYAGYGLTGRPASETDGLKWCYDPNAVPVNFDADGYPLASGTETCQQAVHEYYAGNVWTLNP